MTRLHNYSREELEEQIQLFSAYQSQLAKDVTSVVMIDGATPHVRIYTKRDAGRRALHRVANNISDLADCEVSDSSVKPPKRKHEHYTSQTPDSRWLVTVQNNGVPFVLTQSGGLEDATTAKIETVAVYKSHADAEKAANRHRLTSYRVWEL